MKVLFLVALLLLTTGCATQRVVTITTKPADAVVKINGIDRGRGTVIERFTFERPGDVFYVTASRRGFQDRTVSILRESNENAITLDLKPFTRRISITTTPVPAIISVDGKPLNAEPVSGISTDVEFTVDANDNWVNHKVVAQRRGFVNAEQLVTWTDGTPIYTLRLGAMKKDLRITSNPPGAKINIDGEDVGVAPLTDPQRPFEYDTTSDTWAERTIKVSKPGYDPVERKISWDNGQSDYVIDLLPKTKSVRIVTDPPGGEISIDGVQGKSTPNGYAADLTFRPVDEAGKLPTYTVRATKKTADAEWYPSQANLAWDEGQSTYSIKLREILSQNVPATALKMKREKSEWQLTAEPQTTLGMKFVAEPEGEPQPEQIVKLPPGATIASLSASPDGQYLVYSVADPSKPEALCQMYRTRTDGGGGTTSLSDGRSIDLTPSYTAAGDQIVFSSNRASRRYQIHAFAAGGEGGVARLTSSDSNDLWPNVDAAPKPRLVYQAHIDTRPDPRLFMVQIGSVLQTDLTSLGGEVPRVSPKNDYVVYALPNEKTGRRDIYRVSERGGGAENLTNSDFDNADATWNGSGNRIAFASDRAKDDEAKKNNFDIYVLESGGGTP
ncbi:MAG TPA: PEGA domain-containing protein, partial [Tepidisphaeraceae bacterium]